MSPTFIPNDEGLYENRLFGSDSEPRFAIPTPAVAVTLLVPHYLKFFGHWWKQYKFGYFISS